jgi:membrane-anchored protein YejM (alkaline phosphatase superfamily)
VLLVSRRLPQAEPSFLLGPLAGVLVVIIVHAVWRGRLLVRGIAGGLVCAATIAAIAFAWHVVRDRAELALAIWAEEPIGRLAVEHVFDLEAIRSELPLDRYRPAERPITHRDLVVITFEGVRADRTPPYGGSAPMPALTELGRRGTVFKWAFAPSNVAQRSIPSMITGSAAHRVRGTQTDTALQLDPRHVVLAERLRVAGYETAAFTCCGEYWSTDARTGWARGLEHVVIDDDNTTLARAATAWLTARTSGRPLFLWIHIRPTADPARHTANDADRRALYDRSLASVDAVLADVVTAFSSRPVESSPIFIVTSARGEELGEHGQPFRGDDLYNTLIRVPFVIVGPGVKPQVITENVSLTDLMPTVIDLGGFAPPRGIDGRSLAEAALGTRPVDGAQPIYAAMISDRGTPSSSTIIRGAWKLIDTGSSLELYDVRADPDEKTNHAGQRAQAVTEMRTLLTARTRAGKLDPF